MIATLLLVPPIKRLARATGVIDAPNERKVHTGHVPRMGGLAMFFGCMITFLVYLEGFEAYRGIFLGMVIIVIVGIIDDTIGLEPRLKFLGQTVAAFAAMFMSGVNIDFLGGVLGSEFNLGFLSWPITLVWIVGVTNAINLSDGLDGLAGGISLIAFTCFGILAYQRGDMQIFTLCLVLVGAILGFLRYNTHPAEVFMGDTGSLFLGYCLATFSITANFKSVTALTLITPVLILLVPIADTLWAIIRRIRTGRSPFSADKMHFHHKLMDTGMDHSQTVAAIYGLCTVLSLSAIALGNSSNFKYVLLPLLALAVILFICQVVGAIDLRRITRLAAYRLSKLFPTPARSLLSKLSFRVIQVGAAIYLLSFIIGLTNASGNLLIVTTTVIVLVMFLTMTKSDNGQGYMIFSFFFLAAVMVMVIESAPVTQSFPLSLHHHLEPVGFTLLALGIFGKIIFKKRIDLFLSTPLEFFIFMVLISIALVPQEVRMEYNLAQNTLRTFFLFLTFKAFALNYRSRENDMVAAQAA